MVIPTPKSERVRQAWLTFDPRGRIIFISLE